MSHPPVEPSDSSGPLTESLDVDVDAVGWIRIPPPRIGLWGRLFPGPRPRTQDTPRSRRA